MGGRHTDVGQHHVGHLALDGLEQLRQVATRSHDLELRLERQQLQDPLPRDQVVIGNNDAHAHPSRLYSTPQSRLRFTRRG
jgi:hypothetical protein